MEDKIMTTNNYTFDEQKEIASTILSQLGGHLRCMTGAKNFGCGEDDKGQVYVTFKIGRNDKAVNYVRITLNHLDLYDTEYSRITIKSHKIKSESKGIYNDMLINDFEAATGMYLSLGTMGGAA